MMKWLVVLVLSNGALVGVSASAQAPGPAPTEVEVNPITCWWRSSRSAVMVGERFTVTLTCAVHETDRDQVVVDPSQLDATAVPLAPFEVVSGRRHDDLVAHPLRHFQYEYIVRIVTNTAFGQDADIPALSIKYAVRSSIGGQEGRERTYLLPALPVRVVSLVPAKAGEIRDSAHEAFRELEARRRRASIELMAAAIAFAFAVVLLGLALTCLLGRHRIRKGAGEPLLGRAVLLGGCQRDLRRLATEVARDGWTADRAARALAGLRVATALALNRPVAQSRVHAATPVREGQVLVQGGLLGSRRAVISAAASARAVDQRLAATATGVLERHVVGALAALQESLRVFTAVRYGPPTAFDSAALDAALDAGVTATRRVRLVNRWPFGGLRRAARAAAQGGSTTWTR